jgi:acyl dehydratase
MNTATDLQWNLDKLGEWSEPREFEVLKERTIAYAKATNDEHPMHLSGELAPPVFAIVPVFEVMAPKLVEVVPGEIVMRGVHGEQDFVFHRPIVPGQTLVSRAAAIGVHGTSTGVMVIGKGTTTTPEGEPVVDQYMTLFVRGAQLDVHAGEPLTEHAFDAALRDTEPLARVEHGYDDDQTFRYSAASGDPMPIHLDDNFAKAMGLPGIIVHGLCTMAFTSRAVIGAACPEDPARLKRLAVRFAKIVQPSETITTALWDAGAVDGRRRIAFETTSDNGNVAIKDGLAEVSGDVRRTSELARTGGRNA